MTNKQNKTGEISYTIRFPPELHRSLRILAAYKDTSINKLIQDILSQAVEQARAQIPTL
ncbi:MAG: toxin-antitoxin system HicB family antitoxin [Synergistaceae bacterium]|nr:toxin-antitoxin system HicB family antitoxin [Synergistaceae bacterium]